MIKLLKVSGNWADEMDYNSHLIMEEGDDNWKMWEKIKSYTKEQMEDTKEVSIGIGSNEDVEFENAWDAFDSIGEYDITLEEKEVINKYFLTQKGALHIDYLLEYILEALSENTEEEDESISS